jgi:hypothetical protein
MMKFMRWVFVGIVVSFATPILGAETPKIDPAKVAQLQRLEPLTVDKVNIFVESGQLTKIQAAYIKKHISENGQLALPASAIGVETPLADAQSPTRPTKPSTPPTAPSSTGKTSKGFYAAFGYKLRPTEMKKIENLLADYRHGNRPEIGRQLRQFRPQVNAYIAAAFTDTIDLSIKIALWEEVAGPANPGATLGLFQTHRVAYDLARPVLIAYDKDAGGLIVRRLFKHPDAAENPRQCWMSSRELRDAILHIEELIARCSSVSAATFLMDIYAQRYDKGEAPMRDKGRDRKRLVEACGGVQKKFDEDESDTWKSRLSQSERARIAERLIPWIHRGSEDRKRIARNGLLICLPQHHPDWEDGAAAWDGWWEENKNKLLSEK